MNNKGGSGMKKVVCLISMWLLVFVAAIGCCMAPPVLVQLSTLDNGDVKVSWNKFGGATTYEVRYKISGGKSLWGDSKSVNVHGTSCVLDKLVPGQTYSIVVSNGRRQNTRTVTVPTGDFTGFRNDIEIIIQPRSAKNGSTRKLDAYSVADIEDDDGTAYGMRIEYHYPKLSKPRSYKSSLAFYSPAGYVAYTTVEQWNMKTGNYYTYYKFFDLSHVFSALKSDYGRIPTGTYRLELYLDGDLAGSKTFQVNP